MTEQQRPGGYGGMRQGETWEQWRARRDQEEAHHQEVMRSLWDEPTPELDAIMSKLLEPRPWWRWRPRFRLRLRRRY